MLPPTYRVYYDQQRGLIAVEGTQVTWPAQSLQVTPSDAGIMICMVDFDICVLGPLAFSQVLDESGASFPDRETATAYLNEQFSLKPTNSVNYAFTASTTWIVQHGLNRFPSLTTVDSSGDQIIGDVSYPDTSTVVVRFSSPVAGFAYIN